MQHSEQIKVKNNMRFNQNEFKNKCELGQARCGVQNYQLKL